MRKAFVCILTILVFVIAITMTLWAQDQASKKTTAPLPPSVIEEVIYLDNLSMKEIITSLGSDPIVKKLQEVKGVTSQILARGTVSEIDYANKTISYLDHPVGYETICLTNIPVKEFSLNFAGNPLMKLITIDDANNRISINDGTPENVTEIKKVIKYLDKPKVQLRAELTGITTRNQKNKGFDFTASTEKLPPGEAQPNGVWKYSIGGSILGFMKTQGDLLTLAKLLWYEEHGLSKTMTRPSVTTMSGIPVTLDMGMTYYIPNFNAVTGTSSGATMIPASISIKILPVWLPNGSIMASVDINIPDASTSTSGNSSVPIVSVSNNKVNLPMITLLDGQSMLIGGFIYTSEKDSKSGIPILKFIFGDVFSTRSKNNDSVEMTLAITLSRVEPATAAPAVEAIKEEVQKRAPEGTPGIEKSTMGTGSEPTPKISGTEVSETKQPLEVGSRVIILTDGDNKGHIGIIKSIRSIEATMLDGSKTSRPEYEVELDSGTVSWFTSEDLQKQTDEANPPLTIKPVDIK